MRVPDVADAVTECVRTLVERGVSRFDMLELLLCMSEEPERVWTAHALIDRTTMDGARVSDALAGLARGGFVIQALGEPGDSGYRVDRGLDLGALQALRETHARDRTRVVNAFYASNLENLRSYVRGFKVRRSG
jgi:hypothetical protein